MNPNQEPANEGLDDMLAEKGRDHPPVAI